jgi:hypothetical protein
LVHGMQTMRSTPSRFISRRTFDQRRLLSLIEKTTLLQSSDHFFGSVFKIDINSKGCIGLTYFRLFLVVAVNITRSGAK